MYSYAPDTGKVTAGDLLSNIDTYLVPALLSPRPSRSIDFDDISEKNSPPRTT